MFTTVVPTLIHGCTRMGSIVFLCLPLCDQNRSVSWWSVNRLAAGSTSLPGSRVWSELTSWKSILAISNLINDYEKQSAALNDPRIHLHIGDGRRFLIFKPPQSYDLVIMNTTYHWRAYASMLLSKEFLTLARDADVRRMVAFNTTGSPDALNTASSVFRFAYLYHNFAICADFDWCPALDDPASVEELLSIKPQGTHF